MNLNDLKKELPYKWRVQSTKFGKTTCVAYIDARDCMDILDEVCGPEKWQSIFYEANGLLFCKVGILCDTGREPSQPYTEWVWKSDTGSESKVEKDKEMDQVIKEEEQNVIQMYKDAVEQEKRWANYLFKDGSMIGLNDKLLHNYVEYIANKRMKAIGLKPIYDQPANQNPLPWTEHWLNSRGLQNAPQETEIESYVVGGIKQDVEKDSFKGFTL